MKFSTYGVIVEDNQFACPKCKYFPLEKIDDFMHCNACQSRFPIQNGIPLLFSSENLVAKIDGQDIGLPIVRKIYDRIYQYDNLMGTDLDTHYDRMTKEKLLEVVQTLEGKRVLDLGTGIGRLWDYVPQGVVGYAIDPSAVGVAKAAQRRKGLVVAAAVGENLPFPDQYLDLVVAADTLEHTFSPERTLAEIYRVLKPGAYLSASFPVPDSLRKWGKNQLTSKRINLPFLIRLSWVLFRRTLLFGRATFQPIDRDLEDGRWIEMIESAGFRVIKKISWPEPPLIPLVYLMHLQRD